MGKKSKAEVPEELVYVLRCKNCLLCKTRENVVVGRGNLRSKYLLIGEAPGENEDSLGVPFVGKSGEKLSEILKRAEWNENEDLYITNIVCCRPPSNRKPSPGEIKACEPRLKHLISIMRPKVLILVGSTALQYFIPKARITEVHGKLLTTSKGVQVYAIIHPSAGLRGQPQYFEDMYKDLKKLKTLNTGRDTTVHVGPRVIHE